ncbi:hypothetical protein B4U79_15836, partial [Dinothrombium tinctorium]
MASRRDWFTTFEPILDKSHSIRLGDNHEVFAKGKGTVIIHAIFENEWTPHQMLNVLYVPELKKNLFSIIAATDKGVECRFKGNRVTVWKDNVLKIVGIRVNSKLNKLLQTETHFEANTTDDSLTSWHNRLAHVNIRTVQAAIKDITNVDSIEVDEFFCEGCAYGKNHRLPFKKDDKKRAELPGELIHADVCGPMSTPSVGKSRYLLMFKDDATNYTMAYFLKEKSETAMVFKQFVNEFYIDSGFKVKRIRTDNGLEFVNQFFKEITDEYEIVHETTVAYSPEQNGAIERHNRTIIELPSKTIGNISPYEKIFNKKPDLNQMHVFGSEVFVHIPKLFRSKLDSKSGKQLFVGYDEKKKAIRSEENIETKETEVTQNRYNLRPRKDKQHYACIADEPSTFKEALLSPEANKWKEAIEEKLKSLKANNTWIDVARPKDRKVIPDKWVFKRKIKPDGSIERYKPRLVVKGFNQQLGVDYTETFSPIVRFTSVRVILSLAMKMDIVHFDVKTAFLYGDLEEEIYIWGSLR